MSLSYAQLQALAKKRLSGSVGYLCLSAVNVFAGKYFPEVLPHFRYGADLDECIWVLLNEVDPDRLEKALENWHPIAVAVYGDRELVEPFITAIRHRFASPAVRRTSSPSPAMASTFTR